MVHTFKKASIKRVGKKDAKGHYGKYLLNLKLGDDSYSPSIFMLNLADRYEKDYNKLEHLAWSTKHIRNCILRAYGPKKRELEKVRLDIRQALELQERYTGALKNKEEELESVIRLKNDIESEKCEGKADIYNTIKTLQVEQDSIRTKIESINRTVASLKRIEQSIMQDKRLYSLYRRYNARIGKLSSKMNLKKDQYNEEIHLYWTALMKKLAKKYPTSNKISLKQMTFSDICNKKGVIIREKKDIFQNDQDQIYQKMMEFGII